MQWAFRKPCTSTRACCSAGFLRGVSRTFRRLECGRMCTGRPFEASWEELSRCSRRFGGLTLSGESLNIFQYASCLLDLEVELARRCCCRPKYIRSLEDGSPLFPAICAQPVRSRLRQEDHGETRENAESRQMILSRRCSHNYSCTSHAYHASSFLALQAVTSVLPGTDRMLTPHLNSKQKPHSRSFPVIFLRSFGTDQALTRQLFGCPLLWQLPHPTNWMHIIPLESVGAFANEHC